MSDTPIPETACLECGESINGAAVPHWLGTASPEPGDYSICAYCGAIALFDESMGLREPTDDEYEDAASNPNVARLQLMIKIRNGVIE